MRRIIQMGPIWLGAMALVMCGPLLLGLPLMISGWRMERIAPPANEYVSTDAVSRASAFVAKAPAGLEGLLSETVGVGAEARAVIRFNSETGKLYYVEFKALAAGPAEAGTPNAEWMCVSEGLVGTGETVEFSQGAIEGTGLYRVRCSTP